MNEFLITLITSIIGAAGFALIFSIDPRHLPYAAAGGGICWAAYLAAHTPTDSILVASLAAAFAATAYSELCAHLRRTPATVFLLPSLIPLVPGGSLYYTMSSLISSDYPAAASYAIKTAKIMLGLAGGVIAASLIVSAIKNYTVKKINNQ